MKKVILNKQQQETIYLEDLNDSHIIGIEWKSGDKAQVIKLDRHSYTTSEPGTNNSYLSRKTHNSIQSICENEDVKQALTFDNRKEFINWLIED